LHFCSFFKPTFSGVTREWDALYMPDGGKRNTKVNVLPAGALEGLCLIQNQVLPLDTIEILEVCDNKLVTCNHNMKTRFLCVQVLLVPELTQDLAFLSVTTIVRIRYDGKI
jgi:hypothetical protein